MDQSPGGRPGPAQLTVVWNLPLQGRLRGAAPHLLRSFSVEVPAYMAVLRSLRVTQSAEVLRAELKSLRIPDLRGKTVLDVGAWDGFYSFEAESRGAAAVTALDHYAWSMDLEAHTRHWQESRERGVVPRAFEEMPYWKPDELPGKRGFDEARDLLRSGVKAIVADFMSTDLEALGMFDVVFPGRSLPHGEPAGVAKAGRERHS